MKCYQTRILEQSTSKVWSQNHSFYKESKIQAVSYEICALKWFSCDPARPQIGSRKNIWSKSTETIHAFKLYFSLYENGKDGRLDNWGSEFRTHLLFVGGFFEPNAPRQQDFVEVEIQLNPQLQWKSIEEGKLRFLRARSKQSCGWTD